MARALALAGGALDAIAALFRAAIALLLLSMLAINTANLISRSVLGNALDWVFHWTILMFVWLVCLGFYVYMRGNRDVVVDLIAARLPYRGRCALGLAANAVGLVFMYMVLAPAAQLIAMQTGNMESIALPIYVESLPLFLAAAGLTAHFMVQSLLILAGLQDPFGARRSGALLDVDTTR